MKISCDLFIKNKTSIMRQKFANDWLMFNRVSSLVRLSISILAQQTFFIILLFGFNGKETGFQNQINQGRLCYNILKKIITSCPSNPFVG
jgi:hypothetical protein